MAGLVLFILTLIIVIIGVQISAIAFELTGLPWEKARFQALSCFTGTGFTTKESELITRHSQRRRLAFLIMIIGHIADVSLIATFINFLRPIFQSSKEEYTLPIMHINLPEIIYQLGKFGILLLVLYLIFKFFFNSKLWEFLSMKIRSRMIKKSNLITGTSLEEMTLGSTGYGIFKIYISQTDRYVNETIEESKFKERTGCQILTIERNNRVIPNPTPKTQIFAGDVIYCFGKHKNLHKNF